MKEAFVIFDPTEHVDPVPGKIRKLEGNNYLLIYCLIIAVFVAGYYTIKYYQRKDELN